MCRETPNKHSLRSVMRRLIAVIVSLGLATTIHVDWHLARPVHHQLSLGLSWHWLFAIPVFALVAWYVARAWPSQLLRTSIALIASAVVIGGVLEPCWEYFLEDAPFEWAFGATRNLALAAFVTTGLVSYCIAIAIVTRDRMSPIAGVAPR